MPLSLGEQCEGKGGAFGKEEKGEKAGRVVRTAADRTAGPEQGTALEANEEELAACRGRAWLSLRTEDHRGTLAHVKEGAY